MKNKCPVIFSQTFANQSKINKADSHLTVILSFFAACLDERGNALAWNSNKQKEKRNKKKCEKMLLASLSLSLIFIYTCINFCTQNDFKCWPKRKYALLQSK